MVFSVLLDILVSFHELYGFSLLNCPNIVTPSFFSHVTLEKNDR
jgi:hypothetical protein